MMDAYTEATRWIETEAKALAKKWNRSYSLILNTGLIAYSRGDDPEGIRVAMADYCWSKQPPQSYRSGIQKSGTG